MRKTVFFFSLFLAFAFPLVGCSAAHSHKYSKDWAYDDTLHWHEASCVHVTERKDEAEHNHVFKAEVAPTFEEYGYTVYECECGHQITETGTELLEHNYSDKLSYDETSHWFACTDTGYESLRKDEAEHTESNERIIKGATDSEAGLAEYTCSDCGCVYQKPIYVSCKIITLPTVSGEVYVGQKLSDTALIGGEASVEGSFEWTEADTVISASGKYSVTFTPTLSDVFGNVECEIEITATQLTVTVNSGEGGSANYDGAVNVNYGSSLTVIFTPDTGYELGVIVVDGSSVDGSSYTFDNITANHTVSASFIKTEVKIITLPTVSGEVYVGQKLSDIALTGGEASVEGSFEWTEADTVISASGKYSVMFTPTLSDVFGNVECEIEITATQLTVTVNSGEGGSANYDGAVNINYGSSLTVIFTPDTGYDVEMLIVDGSAFTGISEYTFESIRSNRAVEATFIEVVTDDNSGEESDLPYTIKYVSGTQNAYTVSGNTVTFTEIDAKTVYAISGELEGNIVIDVGDTYKFDLELTGFTLTSSDINPITVLSGDEVSLTAKNGYENFIYDKREAIDGTDTTLYSASIYSLVDLEICGKGKLEVVSDNNNGIHTKDDLQVKNLTLYVKCKDNALKGNDSVEITEANTTLIATSGDCVKTTNSHINETTLNQKGTVSIAGGTHNLYAACDGIDSAYDVSIADGTTATVLNIYTDRYSEYSEEVTAVSESTYYLRYTSSAYKYSVKYYNSDADILWVNVSDTYETVKSGRSTYYYYTFAKKTEYSQFAVYMYDSTQTQGQDTSYYACSSYKTLNDSYDTVALSYRSGSLSVSWTNYTTSSSMPGGMGGGMSEGNSDKGDYSTKGIKASNAITVEGGTVNIQAYDDAIHANNDVALENGATPLGNVTINGGTITAYSHDDGLHADGTLTVTGGNVSVTKSYEGIEGAFIAVSGGSVSVSSSDDGFNATSTTGAAITISGGDVYVYATGDGLDSNSTASKGAILFSGGTTVVICNSNGNSAIDSDGGYNHTGGQVLALMTSGGMTSETTNGNTIGRTTASVSLTKDAYATVSVSSTLTAVVKMPCSLSAFAVYLGSSSASISSSSSTTATLDSNGIFWQP